MNYENGKKYVTKNGSIVECTDDVWFIFKVLKGGHKVKKCPGASRWSEYDLADLYPEDDARVTEKLAGMEIDKPILNFYEVACMMKKNKKFEVTLLGDRTKVPFDYDFFYNKNNKFTMDFITKSEWVKI